MSVALPPHVATDDEALPDPGARLPGEGPDMREVMPIADMIADLRAFDDDEVGYIARWREHLAAIGGSVLLHFARDGDKGLTLGMPCDPQVRHRSRWALFLFEDLDQLAGRRSVLMSALEREWLVWDERPTDVAATTRAMRGFLRTGGRIMVTPDGHVTEGGGVPHGWINGTDEEAREIAQEHLTYFELRRRCRADRQIKRAARLLGHRTSNGWLELRAQG